MPQRLLLSVCLWAAFVPADSFAEDRKPNVVVFLADDQGWGDLSLHGNQNLKTPNIDSLARDGATLDNFYVCAVCAPTRAEFLTARYHPQTGVSGVSEGAGRLNPDETTIADLFKDAGYATGIFGKWHNGSQSPYHPNDRGFDQFYGFTSGHWGHYFSPPLEKNRTRVKGNGYLPDDLTDHALAFIDDNRNRPFLCYVPFNTPHSPFYVDDLFYDRFKDKQLRMRHRDRQKEKLLETRAALAMCENLDWNVGRILERLEQLDLTDDTIVVYFSDNGPNTFRWNGGMKGKKASVDEGGLRSPFLIRWPHKIPAGNHLSQVTGAIDILPTLAALSGVSSSTAKSQNGISFAELLTGNNDRWPERLLFSVWRNKISVRSSRFRMDASHALFDIDNDRGQASDVSSRHPEVAKTLRLAMTKFNQQAQSEYAKSPSRPFTVGYAKTTPLPARDGVPHGSIQRSSKAPNNSFFKHWTDSGDSISWDIKVGDAGSYQATVHYTCPSENVGTLVKLSVGDVSTEATVTEAFDPPLWDKSKERVPESHYFVKDFRPLDLGNITLPPGRSMLTLTCPKLVNGHGIDVHSIVLQRTP